MQLDTTCTAVVEEVVARGVVEVAVVEVDVVVTCTQAALMHWPDAPLVPS